MDRIVVLFEEFYFKRQDREKLVNIAFDVLYAMFFPCPYLWRNVVVDRNIGLALHELGNVKVESRVVYEYDNVGIPTYDVLFAQTHVLKDRAQMEQYGDESHVGQFSIMLYERAAYCRHFFTSVEAKICILVQFLERLHQV